MAIPNYRCGLRDDNHEDLDLYDDGGFHPVELNSTFGTKDQYRVIHKLRYADASTLWLVRDTVENRYLALEIIISSLHNGAYENMLAINKLAASTPDHPGKEYIATAIEHFRIRGPNGSHPCFVYPALGPDFAPLYYMCHEPDRKPPPKDVELHGRLSAEAKRRFARQAAEGLAWLHENGIGHGDFKPANILNPLIDLDNKTEGEILELLGPPIEGELFQTANATKPFGPGQPLQIVQHVNPFMLPQHYLKDKIQIVGFNWSFNIHKPPKEVPNVMVVGYWSPELIFDNQVGAPSDVWALACTLYEIRIGVNLFYECPMEGPCQVASSWFPVLGYIPEKWWTKYKALDGDDWVRNEITMQQLLRKSHTFHKCGKVAQDLSEEEIEVFSDLLLKMLRYEPEDRISLAEVLKHPWMTRDFA